MAITRFYYDAVEAAPRCHCPMMQQSTTITQCHQQLSLMLVDIMHSHQVQPPFVVTLSGHY